ncbi:retrovirus-related pol polyprotein from transposon RE2 [Citrus sinensis]|nr:retrovirus-related pol polyprotein from transposon RE2 [Citrus sinensis]
MANSNQNSHSYNFVIPIKLDHNNFMVWRNQVLASIKGNGLEAAFNCFNGTTNASQFQSSTSFHTDSSPEIVEDPSWYIDSGASTHITADSGKLFNMQPYCGTESLLVGNGNALEIKHIGSAVLDTLTTEPLLLKNILHVPNITKNLLSVSQLLADNNVIVEFVGILCFIKARKTGTLLLKGVATGGLYQIEDLSSEDSQVSWCRSQTNKHVSMFATLSSSVNFSPSPFKSCNPAALTMSVSSVGVDLLHKRLGHPASHTLQTVIKTCNLFPGINKAPKIAFCDACQFGKNHLKHFESVITKTTAPLQLLYADLWGPSHTTSTQGYSYYLSILDDYSRFTWIFPLKAKSDSLQVFTDFKTFIEKHLERRIKTVQTDWGGEFKSFSSLLTASGIHFRHPCPHIHHQNGKIERKHRHIVDIGLTLLAQSNLPLTFWWNAFHTAVFLINRLPTPVLNNVSPYFKLFHQTPDYSFLRVFGCACYPYLRPYQKHKLEFRTGRCIFIGYSPNHKGYQCLHSSGRVYISNHVVFNENSFPYQPGVDFSSVSMSCSSTNNPESTSSIQVLSAPPLTIEVPAQSPHSSQEVSGNFNSPLSQHSLPSYSSNHNSPDSLHSNIPVPFVSAHQLPNFQPPGHSMITRSKAGIFKPKTYITALLAQPSEPNSVNQALQDPKWFNAIHEEFKALQANQTWDLVILTAAVKVVGNKWIFIIKYNSDGSISRYKARLVVKGFHQTYGIDYSETFSPVVKASTVRVILSLAVMNNWIIRQVDVNNAFLNGILVEDVYMAQPEGFVDPEKPHHVCKLKKALYGLKQAPRAWFDRFREAMTSQWHFEHSKSDSSLFYRWDAGDILLVLVYVDDIIITGSNQNSVLKSKYIVDLLNRHEMVTCSPVPTPMVTSHSLVKNSGAIIPNASQYRSIVGALQYVTLTRPELAFSVNKLSQFLSAPTEEHWQACKRILRYLKGTIHYGVQLHSTGSQHMQINCFSDSDWACDRDDRKSVAGYAVFLGPNLVSWSSKKQHVVSRSSIESEYKALALATTEVTWVKGLLTELKIKIDHTPIMWCDNQGAISLVMNPVYHAKTKHIELDIHFIRENVQANQIEVNYVPSEDQAADIFTKALTYGQFSYLRSKLNIFPTQFSLRGDVSIYE